MFQFPGWTRKNFIRRYFSWRASAETWDARCFKKDLLEKQQRVPNTCDILPLKKIFFQNLTCIFQISLKYIKLVISKIFFILVLCSFNFYFKITWPPPNKINSPHQNKNFWPPPSLPQSKDFSETLTPPPHPPHKVGVGVGAYPDNLQLQ